LVKTSVIPICVILLKFTAFKIEKTGIQIFGTKKGRLRDKF